MSQLIKVKKANFLHIQNNNFYSDIGNFKGHGFTANLNSELFFDNITNPSGSQPAVFYKTGLLTGFIQEGGSFTWSNITLSGSGEAGRVFQDTIINTIQASNIIEFIDSTASGLQNGDFINIGNFFLTFDESPTSLNEFNSLERFVNILNSGASGLLNPFGFFNLQNVGVTGFVDNNKIRLFSFARSGENGNNIRVYRQSENLDAIKIHSRYFTGGSTIRPPVNNWGGNFSNTFSLTVENSGFYIIRVGPFETFTDVTGVVWINNFKNYNIITGLLDPRNRFDYSGSLLSFNDNTNEYSGETFLPVNNSTVYTGFNIQILKPNPYDISGDVAEYIVSGDNFIFRNFIEG
jgi:hypothetical protein